MSPGDGDDFVFEVPTVLRRERSGGSIIVLLIWGSHHARQVQDRLVRRSWVVPVTMEA